MMYLFVQCFMQDTAAEHQRWPVLIFHPTEDRTLSQPGQLIIQSQLLNVIPCTSTCNGCSLRSLPFSWQLESKYIRKNAHIAELIATITASITCRQRPFMLLQTTITTSFNVYRTTSNLFAISDGLHLQFQISSRQCTSKIILLLLLLLL